MDTNVVRRYALTEGSSLRTLHWTQQEPMTWPDVLAFLDLRNPSDTKECGLYVLGILAPTARKHPNRKTECVALHRNRGAVVSRSAVVLDADHARADLLAAFAVLGVAGAWHTTYRSTQQQPRYRLILPLARDVSPDEYRALVAALMARLGADQFDTGSDEPERAMFLPSTQGGYSHGTTKGDPLDPDAWLRDAGDVPERCERAALAHSYTGPEYASLSAGERAAADAYVGRVVDDWRGRFAEALDWPEGKSADPAGRGWELLARDGAWALARVAAAPWTPWEADDAAAAWADVLPDEIADAASNGEPLRAKFYDGIVGKAGEAAPDLPPWESVAAQADTSVFTTDADLFGRDVEREAHRLRVREAARALVVRERMGDDALPPVLSLAELLRQPDEGVVYRVDELWPTGGRVLLAAQHKAGKTTLMGNLVRCLVDGLPFLDQFPVRGAGRVLLVDNESSPDQLRRWLRDQAILNPEAVDVVTLRGRLSSFNLLDPVARSEWAAALGPADVMVFDCLRPVLDALGLSEDKEAGRFLEALDELTAEAGIAELVVVHHMGHSNERSRGDSRILDWPDAVWKLVTADPDDRTAPRYFQAYGRDVLFPESQLAYRPEDRHLHVIGGSRQETRTTQVEEEILDVVAGEPGATKTLIEGRCTGSNDVLRAAMRRLVASGRLKAVQQGRAQRHYLPQDDPEAVL